MRIYAIAGLLFLLPGPGWAQWTQWGGNSAHTGAVRVLGHAPNQILSSMTYDPFVRQAQLESGGSLLAHYQSPLVDGNDVMMMFKTGTYLNCDPPRSGRPSPCGSAWWDSQIWNLRAFRWVNGKLRDRWRVESDWVPVPNGPALNGWEPVFHAAMDDRFVYLPSSGGEVTILRRRNGNALRRIRPFGAEASANRYVVSPITVAPGGNNIYYNVLELNPSDPWGVAGTDIAGAWLVKARSDGTSQVTSYKDLIPDAPASCLTDFNGTALPWPPAPNATPPSIDCLSQRPGVNAAPAVGPDGTVYVVTRAHATRAARYSYLVAVNPDLTPKWAASLRNRLSDGCGAKIPIGEAGCRAGARQGVDPATNQPPAGEVTDLSSSSPTVAPDGSILYGAWGRSNYVRGHLFHFSAQGEFLDAFDFGWDTTPAVYEHDGTYSVIIKENNYGGVGSYCGDPRICPAQANGPYYITQLNSRLEVEWRYQNTNPQACERQEDGSIVCKPAPPGGFEWCINAPAVDVFGNVYANAEDGNLYVIGQGGKEIGRLFLTLAVGAAYTPLAIGPNGILYTENDGKLFIIGQ
ncbi:MAG: hypothetical protein HY820_21115 [Acidobacteria bacterium]|nr:hypothetical protein [Acidobacteriota bacterium]